MLIQERLWWEIVWLAPVDLKYASTARSYAIDEAAITMKTILVPTDDNNAMGSALETALIWRDVVTVTLRGLRCAGRSRNLPRRIAEKLQE